MGIKKIRDIKNLIKKTCTKFIKNEKYLLENNLNERTITHKLAEYLQAELPNWNIDCEYNRDYDKVKIIRFGRLKPRKVLNNDTEGRTVFPDIIVHQRGTQNNLIAIEVKKNNSSVLDRDDLDKIEGYLYDLNYKYGFFIKFLVEKAIGIERMKYFYKSNRGQLIRKELREK